ncbi:amino acid ABC transporter substrate-binding protein [Ramlibacter rhizophilus]|uniref:Amino acid ABC transporter substrate-binding protein n=1 Tax=Ramlibacter rhizophilus TaxID=1781167 RepID=A0A4Z0BLS6_9BURK|nr:amino acid ABC transporter substrate-binding protein [Ramlibacter rhizophilus]TFY99711.1 amino acid ABC transporter substrate-binding protein [Ramlibacter rhizophilus]
MSFHSKVRLLRSLWIAACCALAPGLAMAQDVLQRIATRNQVNVGYSENSPPFSFLADGSPAGYSVELCTQVIAEHLRQTLGIPALRVNLLPVSQDQLARFVGGGSVDLMCASVSDTPQRRASMHFSAPIFVAAVKLLVLGEDGPRRLADLKGATVAVLGRTTAEAAVQRASDRHGLDLRLSRVVSTDAALAQLRLRQAQAWARDELLLLGSVAKEADRQRFTLLPEVLSTEPIAIAMPRDDRLQRAVDEALAQSIRSGRLQALYDAWFVHPNAVTPTGFKMPLSGELKAELDRRK